MATILVVDDDPRNRSLLRAYLEPEHRVLDAPDGPRTLEVLARERVDLVILDVMMPGMSGYDVCRKVKTAPRAGFLPVLLLTALHDQEARNEGLGAGADDFLTKPVDRRELLLRVRAFLRIREQEALIRRQLEHLAQLQALKDDLVTLIVHDLRNPLSGVLGYLEIIEADLEGPAAEPLREPIAKARESAARVREALDEILQVRLMEEAVIVARREATDAAALLAEAIRTVEGAGRARGIRFDVEAALGDDPMFPLDRALVRRAVENLLGNAVKYSPKSGAITVRVRREPGGRLAIEVADRGPGVPEGMRAALFQKYGSIEARRGEARRGFGLGLYLVKLVATAHGGEASISTREGGGAVFRIVLAGGAGP